MALTCQAGNKTGEFSLMTFITGEHDYKIYLVTFNGVKIASKLFGAEKLFSCFSKRKTIEPVIL